MYYLKLDSNGKKIRKTKIKFIKGIIEHIDVMVGVSPNLINGLEFKI